MTWKNTSCLITGEKNKERQRQCQDHLDFFCDDMNDIVFGVVSDGAGSKKHSDIGAKIAVKESIEFIKNQMYDIPHKIKESIEFEKNEKNYIPHKNKDEVKIFYKFLVEHVIRSLEEESKNIGCNSEELYCTLVVFFVSQNYFTAIQIGDGLIVIKVQEENKYELLFSPDKGLYKNMTRFINEKNLSIDEKIINFAYGKGVVDFIFAASDGMEDICLEYLGFSKKFGVREWKPFTKFFSPIHSKMLKVTNINIFSQALKDKLDNINISKKHRDDKALIICCNMNSISNKNIDTPDRNAEFENKDYQEDNLSIKSENSSLQRINQESNFKLKNINLLLRFIKAIFRRIKNFFSNQK